MHKRGKRLILDIGLPNFFDFLKHKCGNNKVFVQSVHPIPWGQVLTISRELIYCRFIVIRTAITPLIYWAEEINLQLFQLLINLWDKSFFFVFQSEICDYYGLCHCVMEHKDYIINNLRLELCQAQVKFSYWIKIYTSMLG